MIDPGNDREREKERVSSKCHQLLTKVNNSDSIPMFGYTHTHTHTHTHTTNKQTNKNNNLFQSS